MTAVRLADELGSVRTATKCNAEEGVIAITAGAWRGRCAECSSADTELGAVASAGRPPRRQHVTIGQSCGVRLAWNKERREMPGWFGYAKCGSAGPPPDPAYGRVTNAERFRPLHSAMLEIIGRLENDFDAKRTEGYGLDTELEQGLDPERPHVRLNPRNHGAAPIAVVISTIPGLHVRFGRWYSELFPSCGCDPCDESAEGEIERLNEMVDDVVAGRFCEAIRCPLISLRGTGWRETTFWSSVGMCAQRARVDGLCAREMAGGRRRLDLNWEPWCRRRTISSRLACGVGA